ncbi:hypothetical protein [Oceanospirillum sanctuarii]|uniref:hypothetical protein n=1 Tax=Oceanospirillum sanctuarii TaxID=1434821 RepID=UPI001FECA495|nr:hypothetical protein [Oceanospirillum sanctuarii]
MRSLSQNIRLSLSRFIGALTLLSALFASLLVSPLAQAHFPIMTCEQQSGSVHCETGFSDGSLSVNKPVTVLDYDDQVLLKLTTDAASSVTFSAPAGEYYIRFDSGHEQPVEIDYDEL